MIMTLQMCPVPRVSLGHLIWGLRFVSENLSLCLSLTTMLTLICSVWRTELTRSRPGSVLLQPAFSDAALSQPAFVKCQSQVHEYPAPCSGTSVLTQCGRAGNREVDVNVQVKLLHSSIFSLIFIFFTDSQTHRWTLKIYNNSSTSQTNGCLSLYITSADILTIIP